jgi:hypothetical protein
VSHSQSSTPIDSGNRAAGFGWRGGALAGSAAYLNATRPKGPPPTPLQAQAEGLLLLPESELIRDHLPYQHVIVGNILTLSLQIAGLPIMLFHDLSR